MREPFDLNRTVNGIRFVWYKDKDDSQHFIMIVFQHNNSAQTSFFQYDSETDRDFDMVNMEDEWLMDAYNQYLVDNN